MFFMLLIDRNIILLQIKEKHATISTSRTTTKVQPSLKNKRGSTILVLPPLIFHCKAAI
ncbi:hypothetical protein BACUNI_03972 [Bacteroides uniformis ATCC 8492]|jgi:hypothetical protein|uniref:Uncharacterized protein n=1 Tax=Bacteroides uniformis (strain ATCC 8492 / DSM 6597 / CCUG 4942 / CIP 103695 / JCM 5828 / KCTC 5204 / NCTC 13054 / VPI 0061) TaxID=411479 RepID=A0ABC9N6Q5_BACUC|nr:hypothetical protein BACUNI_03972 [Bacteroides uniformis ATCC 8492]